VKWLSRCRYYIYYFIKYERRFGLCFALSFLLKRLLCHGIISFKLPGYPARLYMRAKGCDAVVFNQIFLFDSYDLGFLQIDPTLIIDAGANIGFAAVYFAKKYPQARIIAVEPESSNYDLLVRNTKQYRNIVPVKAAVWPKQARLQIANPDAEKWAVYVREAQTPDPNLNVDAVTIDKLAEDYPRIDILKIDIEGAEKELFESGYESWLDRCRVIIIETHDHLRDGCAASFYRAISHYQFKQYIRGENIVVVK